MFLNIKLLNEPGFKPVALKYKKLKTKLNYLFSKNKFKV